MATITRFEDLPIWQQSRTLCVNIHQLFTKPAFYADFKLRDQINGSSGSVMDNIAEGFERGSRNEFIQFLGYSKASCSEVKSQLYRALDRHFITETEFQATYELADEISKQIHYFIKYLNASKVSGIKYKNRVDEPVPDYSEIKLPFIS